MSFTLNAILILLCLSVSKGLESYGTWRVVANNGARGFPVRKGNVGMSNVWAGQPCCETWSHDGWTKLSQEEALQQSPPLEVDAFKSDETRKWVIPSGEYKRDSDGVWRGTMSLHSRARLTFVPPESGRAVLAIYLCETEEMSDDHCVSIVLTGSSPNGKTLRYQTKRPNKNDSRTEVSQGVTSNIPNGHIVSEKDHVHEEWQMNNSYLFRIARSARGDFQVELDNGDLHPSHEITVQANSTYNKITVSLLPTLSDTARELRMTDDMPWHGDFSFGDNITVSFSPNSYNTGHLGLALCEDQFRDDCSTIVIDGINADKLVRNDPARWTAGSEEADKPDLSKYAEWGKSFLRFTLTREYNGTVIITVDGGVTEHWHVSSDKEYLVVDSYHNEGIVSVHSQSHNITASVWRLDKDKGELRSPALPKWFVDEDICVSVATRVSKGAEISVSVQLVGGNKDSSVLDTLKYENGTQWIRKRITTPPSRILQKHKVQIVVAARQPAQTKYPVLVQWAAGCDPTRLRYDEVSSTELVSLSSIKDTVGFTSNERYDEDIVLFGVDFSPRSHNVCQNEGYIDKDAECKCRPGFTGRLCEKGCGRNRFGENCEDRCLNELSLRECRGMLLCTPDLPCDCGSGLKGPRCDQACEPGKYGVGCRQECGRCAHGDTCDPYTGECKTGCSGPRLPPFCNTECGRSAEVVGLIGDGGLARQAEYPWHVGIYEYRHMTRNGTTGTKDFPEQKCGGTLINVNVVISVANCFWDELTQQMKPSQKYSVGFAKTKRDWNADEEFPHRVQKRDVSQIHVHPKYRGIFNSNGHDLAIIELATPVDLTAFVIPACIDLVGGYEEDLKGSVGRLPGWGQTQKKIPSEDLKEGNFAHIFWKDCLNIVPLSFKRFVTQDVFCAGERGGAYLRKGDNGGGLVFHQNSAWFLRGVASTRPSDEGKTYSAFTNLSYHRDWIVDIIQNADLQKAFREAFF